MPFLLSSVQARSHTHDDDELKKRRRSELAVGGRVSTIPRPRAGEQCVARNIEDLRALPPCSKTNAIGAVQCKQEFQSLFIAALAKQHLFQGRSTQRRRTLKGENSVKTDVSAGISYNTQEIFCVKFF
jgi:hypothetical protein